MYKIIFLLIVFSSFYLKAQNVFKTINKAEKLYSKGKFDKSLKFLEQATKEDTGFCGNVVLDVNRAVNLLKFKIYFNQSNYKLAINSLDSLYFFYKSDNIDSMRIECYKNIYGNQYLSKSINQALSNLIIHNVEYNFTIELPLPNNQSLYFKLGFLKSIKYSKIGDVKKQKEIWINEFKASNNYTLITNTN